MPDFATLAGLISGPVLTPEDPEFGPEISGFNLAVVHRPDVVVGITGVDDAVAAVTFARDNGMHVGMFATGHGSHVPVESGMLVTTGRIDHLSIDPASRIATIGAGVQWDVVVAAAAELGLAPVAGSSSNVGAVGYLLGGGLGPMSRSFGFSSDYIREFTLVTADGEVRTVSADENPDLFWALRGGKGGFGIVTEVRIELLELTQLYAGSLIFAEEHVETAMRGWVDYTRTEPDDVTTSAAVFHFPPAPQVPAPFRGRTLLMVRFAFPGDVAVGESLAAPLRALAPVEMDGIRDLAPAEVATIHNDPTEPGPAWSRGMLLGAIDQEFVTALLGFVGPGTQPPIMVTEIRQLGAATRTDVAGGSAVGGRASDFALALIGAPNPALFAEVLPAATDEVIAGIAPWISPETNINYAGHPDEAEFQKSWPAATFARLAAIRADVDPQGVFAYGPAIAG